MFIQKFKISMCYASHHQKERNFITSAIWRNGRHKIKIAGGMTLAIKASSFCPSSPEIGKVYINTQINGFIKKCYDVYCMFIQP